MGKQCDILLSCSCLCSNWEAGNNYANKEKEALWKWARFGGGFLDIVLPPKHKFVGYVTREINMSALKGHSLGNYSTDQGIICSVNFFLDLIITKEIILYAVYHCR